MALLPMLLELYPAATAAEEAPLPAAFLEFLAEMVEEEGELLDPLLLVPEPLELDTDDEAARDPEAVRDGEPEEPLPAGTLLPAESEAPESAPEASSGRSGSGARGAGAPDHD